MGNFAKGSRTVRADPAWHGGQAAAGPVRPLIYAWGANGALSLRMGSHLRDRQEAFVRFAPDVGGAA
jgi:hypothetical protein